MSPRTIVCQYITNFNGFFLPVQLWGWEGSVSIALLQQSLRPVSEQGSLNAWEEPCMVPLPFVPCTLTVKEIPACRLEGAMAFPIQIWGVRDQDHCRAHFSVCLELASKPKSLGKLNATDFRKADFKHIYKPRLRHRSVFLNYSCIWSQHEIAYPL